MAAAAPTSKKKMENRITPNDVLLGRGGNSFRHIGNKRFRDLARDLAARYCDSTKLEKSQISKEMIKTVKNWSPPGRFLKKVGKSEWEEVDDVIAREKASQCLRDAVSTLTNDMKVPEKDFSTVKSEFDIKESSSQSVFKESKGASSSSSKPYKTSFSHSGEEEDQCSSAVLSRGQQMNNEMKRNTSQQTKQKTARLPVHQPFNQHTVPYRNQPMDPYSSHRIDQYRNHHIDQYTTQQMNQHNDHQVHQHAERDNDEVYEAFKSIDPFSNNLQSSALNERVHHFRKGKIFRKATSEPNEFSHTSSKVQFHANANTNPSQKNTYKNSEMAIPGEIMFHSQKSPSLDSDQTLGFTQQASVEIDSAAHVGHTTVTKSSPDDKFFGRFYQDIALASPSSPPILSPQKKKQKNHSISFEEFDLQHCHSTSHSVDSIDSFSKSL
jgi:hypothetical protein